MTPASEQVIGELIVKWDNRGRDALFHMNECLVLARDATHPRAKGYFRKTANDHWNRARLAFKMVRKLRNGN